MSVIPAGDFALQTIQQEISAMIREGMTVQRLKIIQTQAQNLHYELKVARTAIQQVREAVESVPRTLTDEEAANFIEKLRK